MMVPTRKTPIALPACQAKVEVQLVSGQQMSKPNEGSLV